MKKLGTIVLVSLVLLVGAGVAQNYYRTDPVTRHISKHTNGKEWGTEVNLIPKIFAAGDSFETIDKALTRAGYTTYQTKYVSEKHKEYVSREVSTFVCTIKYYVSLEFDDDLKLKNANGTVREHGCL